MNFEHHYIDHLHEWSIRLFCSLLISISHVSVKNQFENGLCELKVEIYIYLAGILHIREMERNLQKNTQHLMNIL